MFCEHCYVYVLVYGFLFFYFSAKKGRPAITEIKSIREHFYNKNTNALISNGKLIESTNPVYDQLARITGNSKGAEYNAALRFFKKENLIAPKIYKPENEKDYAPFQLPNGNNVEKYAVDIRKNLFLDQKSGTIKNRTDFMDDVIKIIFDQSKKPCCWAMGKVTTPENELRWHGFCSNKDCSANVSLFTENNFERLHIYVGGFKANVSHSKRKYVTSKESNEKFAKLLATEAASITHAMLARELIDDDLIYPAHLPSVPAHLPSVPSVPATTKSQNEYREVKA